MIKITLHTSKSYELYNLNGTNIGDIKNFFSKKGVCTDSTLIIWWCLAVADILNYFFVKVSQLRSL